MAFVTTPFYDSPQFTVWLRHDDASGGIQRLSWENRGGGTATVTLNAPILAAPIVQVVGPGQSGSQNVPGNLRVGLTKQAVDQGEVTIEVAWEPIRA